MGTSAWKIEAQLQQLESPLTNTALGYWCRLKERFKTQAVVVDDDERNRGPRCELVHCGLIKLITEGICCPLLDQLRRLRDGWRRRKDRSRNIREAEAAQMLLPFGGAEKNEDCEQNCELLEAVKSQGGTASPQQQRAGKRQVRKPRQRGLMRRIRRWEVQRRDMVKAAAPPQTPPIERNTASSCGASETSIQKSAEATPEIQQFLADFNIKPDEISISKAKEFFAAAGPEQARRYTAMGKSRNKTHPVGWGLKVWRNHAGEAAGGESPPRWSRRSTKSTYDYEVAKAEADRLWQASVK